MAHVVWVYTQSLAERLDAATWLETTRELRGMGWEVTLVTADRPGTTEVEGVAVLPMHKPPVYLLGQAAFHARVLRWILARWGRVDVVLFNQMSAPWLLPLRALRALDGSGPLLVMDTRTLPMVAEVAATRRDRLRHAYYATMSRLANRVADGRTAITVRMADAEDIPVERLWGVWPSAVDLALFRGAQDGRHWPEGEGPVRLVYVGALHHERNLLPLCRAVVAANAEGMAMTLTLVGDGTQRGALEEFARSTEGRVRVVGRVPRGDVPRYLASAHVGVLPFPAELKFEVASPIKLFEYMGAGLAVLATRIAAHTDVVGGGSYVVWAEGADEGALLAALRDLWARRGHLEAMGAEAARAAREHTWQDSAARLGAAMAHGLRRFGRRAPARVGP